MTVKVSIYINNIKILLRFLRKSMINVGLIVVKTNEYVNNLNV